MRLAMPAEARQVSMGQPELAVQEFASIIGDLRNTPASAADLEPLAAQAVDAALREGAFLMAVVTPEGADPALLTGVALVVPAGWDTDTAEALRDSVENVGGPDVRETMTVETAMGPAVIAQRIPGPEQARERLPLTLQLQGFIPEPDTGRMLLLTLASPSQRGWHEHQRLFSALVASATPSGELPAENPGPSSRSRRTAENEDESFEHHTFRL
ncbi:hypothetical protein [Actinokineospora sp.]|uniref:hypothetical protein n=1 Tax=Actinokineospora sp. TaxID=1872133 RepID=UPI004037E05F